MPLCPQITNTPITVVQNSDFTVSSVLPVVPATTTQVDAAQSSADAAAANAAAAAAAAAAASAIAATAVQTSANTIVNSSNQLTAINGNGITVYAGSSPTSGARVVLNSAGLAGFNTGGGATFAISSSTGTVEVTGGILSGGSITGTAINVPTVGSPAFSVNALGQMTATSANITGTITATGGTISGALSVTGSLTGGTIQTSAGSASVSLVGSNNSLTFKTSNTNVGHILPLSSFGVLTHYGATADPSGGTFPQMFVGSANVSLFANTSNGIGVGTSTGVQITGTTSLNSQTNYPGVATGAGTSMVLVTTGSRIAIVTSSERFKEEIKYITSPGWLDKVMAMKPITYKTSTDFVTEGEPNETQYGFLAEDIYDLGGGLEKTVVLDPLGEPFSLSYDRLTVFLTLAIKELKAEIDQLKGE